MDKLKKVGILLGAVTAVELLVFSHYNGVLARNSVHSVVRNTVRVSAPLEVVKMVPRVNLDAKNPLAGVSDDGQQFAYVDRADTLHVRALGSSKDELALPLHETAVYLAWIDSQSLFVGTATSDGGGRDLKLSTIDVQTKTVRLIHDFMGAAPTAAIKEVSYSNYTNDVYVLLADKFNSALYHFDTNGTLNTVDVGGRYISRVAVTSTNDHLYLQDFALGTPNLLEAGANGIQVIQRNCVLLQVDGNVMYYGVLNKDGNVTMVNKYHDGVARKIATLSRPANPNDVFVSKKGTVLRLLANHWTDTSGNAVLGVSSKAKQVVADNAIFVFGSASFHVVM